MFLSHSCLCVCQMGGWSSPSRLPRLRWGRRLPSLEVGLSPPSLLPLLLLLVFPLRLPSLLLSFPMSSLPAVECSDADVNTLSLLISLPVDSCPHFLPPLFSFSLPSVLISLSPPHLFSESPLSSLCSPSLCSLLSLITLILKETALMSADQSAEFGSPSTVRVRGDMASDMTGGHIHYRMALVASPNTKSLLDNRMSKLSACRFLKIGRAHV